jgi:hypothetical protein
MKHPKPEFLTSVIGSVFLFALGGWFAITQKANFTIGGTDTRRGSLIDLEGPGAIALGTAIIGVGIMNIAFGMVTDRRKTVFWVGAALFLIPLIYGVGLFVLDVYQFITSVMTS